MAEICLCIQTLHLYKFQNFMVSAFKDTNKEEKPSNNYVAKGGAVPLKMIIDQSWGDKYFGIGRLADNWITGSP